MNFFPVPRTLVVLLSLTGAISAHAELDITPNVVTVGKENVVQLAGKEASQIKQIQLLPGGPKIVERLALGKGERETWQLVFQHEGTRLQLKRNNVQLEIANKQDLLVNLNNQKQLAYRASAPLLDMLSVGDLLVLANEQNGVTVLDIKQPEAPLWMGSHQKLGRVIRVLPAGDKQVLALNDADIVYLLDVKNPVEPTVINLWRSAMPVRDLGWSKQQLYVKGDTAVEVIDFSAVVPQVSNNGLNFGQGVNYGGQRRVDIVGNIAYVADWFSGIHLYDISNPKAPTLLSSFHTPGSPKGMLVRDNIAYVPDDDHGLQIIDVQNPHAPKQISHIQTNGLGYTPKLVGGLLYLASHRGGFQILDVSNPAKPVQLSEVDTLGKAWSLDIKGDKLYVADDDNGLLIFDVKDSAQPKQIGQFKPGTAAEEVLIRDNIAFVAFFDDGLYVLDIADPSQPKVLSHTKLAGNSRGLDLIANKLYVASWLAGVHILDVSDLSAPKVLGAYDTRGATWGLKAQGNYLYTMDWWGGLAVLDVSDASNPHMVGDYNHRGFVNDIQAQGNYAYVAQGSNGLQVFEISNPVNPTWVTGVNFIGDAKRVVLDKKHAYLAMGDAGFAIADVSDPFNTHWVSQTQSEGHVVDVAVAGQYVWLLDEKQGVLLYDVSNPAKPRMLGRINLPATAIAARDNDVLIATAQGLYRYNLLKQQSFVALKTPIQKLLWSGTLAYAAQGNSVQSYDAQTLKPNKKVELEQAVNALSLANNQLFVGTEYEVVQLDASSLVVNNRYKQLSNVSSVISHNNALFMGGAKTINAQKLLPSIALENSSFKLPATTAIGSYDLLLTISNNKQQRINNAVRVEMPKFSKPKITLEEFKALLEQQRGK